MSKQYMDKLVEGIQATMTSHPTALQPSAETQSACAAFVRYMNEVWGPLPVDPVMLLISYERYQSALAAEAVGISWLDTNQGNQLRGLVREAILDSAGIIGCEVREAGDSMSLWLRGVVEQRVQWEEARARQAH